MPDTVACAYSSFTPVARTSGAHLACSACTNAANSAGVVGEGAAFWLSNCFLSSADVSTETVARRIIEALESNRNETVLGRDARTMLALNRFLPRLVDRLMARKVRQLYADELA